MDQDNKVAFLLGDCVSWRHPGQMLPGGAIPLAFLVDGRFTCIYVPDSAVFIDRWRIFEVVDQLTLPMLENYLRSRECGKFVSARETPVPGHMPRCAVFGELAEYDPKWYVSGSSTGRTTARRAIARWRAEEAVCGVH